MIFVIDDDRIMAECIARACKNYEVKIFGDAINAMNAISGGEIPELIFLDVLLTGPDGFTFLNELISYDDTAKIPVVVVSSLDFEEKNLDVYGIVGTLTKDRMLPQEILAYAEKYVRY